MSNLFRKVAKSGKRFLRPAFTVAILFALALSSLTLPVAAMEQVELDLEELSTPLSYYQQYKGEKQSITVYNWGEYISTGTDGSLAVNQEFEKLTGIKVNYVNFATNEELYSKLRSGNSAYDIIIPSDYMISKMITEDMLTPLDKDKIPNYNNTDEKFRSTLYDPTGDYSVPYTWGLTGIIYNKELIDPEDDVETWDILWNEKYQGEILMFYNARDTFAIAQKKLGYSISDVSIRELQTSLLELQEQKPLVQAYVMDEIFDIMVSGSSTLAPYYAGDAVTMMEDNENLDFAFPKEGANIFVDAICIPVTAPNPDAAHLYVNFLLEGQVAAANSEFIGYATPNAAAEEYLDPDFINNPIVNPPDQVIENAEYFTELPKDVARAMDEYWADLLSSDSAYNEFIMPIFLIVGLGSVLVINLRRRRKGKA